MNGTAHDFPLIRREVFANRREDAINLRRPVNRVGSRTFVVLTREIVEPREEQNARLGVRRDVLAGQQSFGKHVYTRPMRRAV